MGRGDGWADVMDEVSDCNMLKADEIERRFTLTEIALNYKSRMARRQGVGWRMSS